MVASGYRAAAAFFVVHSLQLGAREEGPLKLTPKVVVSVRFLSEVLSLLVMGRLLTPAAGSHWKMVSE